MIFALDRGIGRVMAALKAGIDDNTLVIFSVITVGLTMLAC